MTPSSGEPLRLIATEEAFATAEYQAEMKKLIDRGVDDFDLYKIWFSGDAPSPESEQWASFWKPIIGQVPDPADDNWKGWLGWWSRTREQMFDLGARRLEVMDAAGIDVFLLSLISPGLQLFDADTGSAMAEQTNDALAEAVRRHPDRFAGLASFAPQDPKRAAKEIERAIGKLGLNGLIVNSHTQGEYLDDPKFWPIFEAACAVDAAIYIHPRNPPTSEAVRKMLTLASGQRLTEVIWGYQMETGLHALRLIMGGVFQQFPKLKIVLGHLGENVPAWLFRINWATQYMPVKPAELFRQNFWVTTSGVSKEPLCHDILRFCHSVLGPERILFAVDYPFGDSNQSAEFLRSAELPRGDLEKIASKNAEQLFRIPPAGKQAGTKTG
jgi:predicted TIM-barrel fold metal-dependent hydrolase